MRPVLRAAQSIDHEVKACYIPAPAGIFLILYFLALPCFRKISFVFSDLSKYNLIKDVSQEGAYENPGGRAGYSSSQPRQAKALPLDAGSHTGV